MFIFRTPTVSLEGLSVFIVTMSRSRNEPHFNNPDPGSQYQVPFMTDSGQPGMGDFWLAGHKDAGSDEFMSRNNIMYVVKTSGDSAGFVPPTYGRRNGEVIPIAELPVNHLPSFRELPNICHFCREAFQNGGGVVVHCNKGFSRTPAGVAAIRWELDGTPMRRTI